MTDDPSLSPEEVEIIIDILYQLGHLEGLTNEFKGKAFNRSANVIKEAQVKALYQNIPLNIKNIGKLKGVGKSTITIIKEIQRTGGLRHLNELKAKQPDAAPGGEDYHQTIEFFTQIYGIGPIKAAKFYQKGHRTIEDVWEDKDLTNAQRDGIIWLEHIKLPIPRDEIMLINEVLETHLQGIQFKIVGSYRRGKETSGDIDILILSGFSLTMDDVLERLKKFLVSTLAQGCGKFMGIFRLSEEYNSHRIDIRLSDPENWPYMELYFTGSCTFNVLLRERAIMLGLRLSEYDITITDPFKFSGYYNGLTAVPKLDREIDILRFLGVGYLRPSERKNDIIELPTV